MRVEIMEFEERADGARVQVASDVGRFGARWRGASPAVGAQLEVELGVDQRLTWGVDAREVDDRPHEVAPGPDGGVVLWASVEQVGEDGFVGLRLGPCVVMVEADGPPAPVGATVRVELPELTLFDTDI